ncbi:MAG: rod shape-determining protein RodA [Candidatus Cloacimonadaceae bacterium]
MINRKKFDYTLAIVLGLLIIAGIIAIYTASTSKIGEQVTVKDFWWRQFIFAFVLVGLLYLLIRIPMPVIDVLIVPLYILNLILLFLVLFTPAINGAHRWFNIFGFSYQPSESAKLLTILLTARVLSKEHLSEMRQLIYGFLCVIPPSLLVMIEPDFGTSMMFWIALLAMFAAAGVPVFYLLLIVSPIISIVASFHWLFILVWIALLVFVLLRFRLSWVTITVSAILNLFLAIIMPVFWSGMKNYQQDRILTFIDPLRDPLGSGYQIIQAKIAVGSGGKIGKGWLEGTQKNMNFLPEHHTDFIYSIIGEEFGFLGSLVLLLLFFILFWRITIAIRDIRVKERKVVATGIFGYLLFQTFINIGMNIGLVPTTGIPLPFISYGGSNLLINGIAVGMVLKYLNERGFMK